MSHKFYQLIDYILIFPQGTIANVWQNQGSLNGCQPISGNFTTFSNVASFQVGTAVTLDKGYLDFSGVTLTAYSAALPSAALSITAGGTYQFTGQVAGALAAPLGQGGRIVAVYANVDGQSAGEDLLWQNPTNFNGTVPVQQTFTANAGAATLRLALTAVLDAGHLGFGDFNLQHLTAGDVIRRSTYMLAGQAVAVRVSGDPDGNDGLHYLYSDHLGSASAIRKDDGSAPIITRYLPFGGYRGGSGPNEVTDRGFTGQPENMDLGLYYYQARFYVPAIGRFASADTIIPDPANPQSYNRYSYVLNRALNFTDPTGHRDCAFDNYCDPPTATPKHETQQLTYPGNLPVPVIEKGAKTYDAYCSSGAGCTFMEVFRFSGLEAYVLEWALVENLMPGSNGSYVGENIGNETIELAIGAGGKMLGREYLGPIDSIWEAHEFAKQSSFSKFAEIVHNMNYSQAVANGGKLQPLTVVVIHNVFITGEIETHYNRLAEEYVTVPHFITQIPIFAIFVMGEEGTISQAVLISNGYWSDFQSLLSSVIGQ